MEPAAAIAAYYRDPAVRARIAEYCAGSVGLAGYGGRRRLRTADMAPVAVGAELAPLLADGADVCRSLSDRRGALIQLDVDYVNAVDPAEAYRDPEVCFRRLEPVYRVVHAAFADANVAPLELMTGRGYHFTARAVRGSRLHRELMSIGRIPPALRARYEGEASERRAASMGAAHLGAGRLVESLAHDVMSSVKAEVPVTLADVPPPGRGPFICLDLSAYGDPVSSRHARSAFSSHQKAAETRLAGGPPFVIAIPRGVRSLPELLAIRSDPAAAARLAADVTAGIPDVTEAPRWLRSYADSVLAWFHRRFDEEPSMGPPAAADVYARIPSADLPLCVRRALEAPNPGLLVPTALRAVALVLWGRGWHPRHIADLVRSRYEADHGWGDLWARYEPSARADFYVRLFAGAVVAGLDHARDFTCHSQQLRGGCPGGECGHELKRLFPGRNSMVPLGVGW
jgi:hypothetical protein